jgi:hypothetical protein
MPAPNSYSIAETEEHMKTRLSKMKERKDKFNEKASFLDTLQLESTHVPGPGNYNPHVLSIIIQDVSTRSISQSNYSSFKKELFPKKN